MTLSIPEGWLWTVRGKQGSRVARLRVRIDAICGLTDGCEGAPGE